MFSELVSLLLLTIYFDGMANLMANQKYKYKHITIKTVILSPTLWFWRSQDIVIMSWHFKR